MELSKKTTILFSQELHDRLVRLSRQRGTSLGDLVRTACRLQYGIVSRKERLAAVKELAALYLPVGSPGDMKKESVPDPEDLEP